MKNADGQPDNAADDSAVVEASDFASLLRKSIQQRGLTLGGLQRRLRDRGFDISVSALSMWRSGTRRPEGGNSIDVVYELEQILDVSEGTLVDAVGPSRRLGPDRHEPFASLIELPLTALTVEPVPELFERSGALGAYIDAGGSLVRTVNRTLWQARRDGAQDATVFYRTGPEGTDVPEITGTIGCDLVDIAIDPDDELLRATLRLNSPLTQGALALTERESRRRPTDPVNEISVVAPRHQAEVMLYVAFDAQRLPRRLRVLTERDGELHSRRATLNGAWVVHAEFNFGPGVITLQWDW